MVRGATIPPYSWPQSKGNTRQILNIHTTLECGSREVITLIYEAYLGSLANPIVEKSSVCDASHTNK